MWRSPNVHIVASGNRFSFACSQSRMLGFWPYVSPSQWMVKPSFPGVSIEAFEGDTGFTILGVSENVNGSSFVGWNGEPNVIMPKRSINSKRPGRNMT